MLIGARLQGTMFSVSQCCWIHFQGSKTPTSPRPQVGKMEAALKMALKKQPRALIEAPAPACPDKKATMSLARRLAEEQDAVGAYRQQVARLEERLQNESTLGDRVISDSIVGLVSDVLMLTLPRNLS